MGHNDYDVPKRSNSFDISAIRIDSMEMLSLSSDHDKGEQKIMKPEKESGSMLKKR